MRQIGPGKYQRSILLALHSFERDEGDLEWDLGGPNQVESNLAFYDEETRAYEAGRRVEYSELQKATQIRPADLSRSLRRLHDRGLVLLRSVGMEDIPARAQGRYFVAKYAGLTKKGREIAKRLTARVEKALD